MLRIAQGRGFRVDVAGSLPDIGRFEDREPLRIGGHDAVFDPVVHHFHEMARATRAAMQIAVLGCSTGVLASGGARDVATTWREGSEDRVEMPHHVALA